MKIVKENECVSIESLRRELRRLQEEFEGNEGALEAIDALVFWMMEESMPFADDSYFVMRRVFDGEVTE